MGMTLTPKTPLDPVMLKESFTKSHICVYAKKKIFVLPS